MIDRFRACWLTPVGFMKWHDPSHTRIERDEIEAVEADRGTGECRIIEVPGGGLRLPQQSP
jgi:hypothetical protein